MLRQSARIPTDTRRDTRPSLCVSDNGTDQQHHPDLVPADRSPNPLPQKIVGVVENGVAVGKSRCRSPGSWWWLGSPSQPRYCIAQDAQLVA
jgi:hypothetical protein